MSGQTLLEKLKENAESRDNEICRAIDRPINQKEVDRVLREWAEDRIRARRACAAVERRMKGNRVVMSQDEYDAFCEAVIMAEMGFACGETNGVKMACGYIVVISNAGSKSEVLTNEQAY